MQHAITIRTAVPADAAALRRLHRASLWGLGVFDYTLAEIDSILRHVQTLDPELIETGRYYVAEIGGELAGSGGWSEHALGQPMPRSANSNRPMSGTPSAKLRAIFVNPKFARAGIGRAVMAHIEAEARAAGLTRAEGLATLSSLRFYEGIGYTALRRLSMPLADGTMIALVHMKKSLAAAGGMRAA
jgi:GNAT superfamily N-acetyltransferase